MDKDMLWRQYQRKLGTYNRLVDAVKGTLADRLSSCHLRISDVSGRVKSFDSFYEKALRKQYTHPFLDVRDICGVRVVCLVLSDLMPLQEVIESSFIVIESDQKVSNRPDDELGYMSNHYIVRLSDASEHTTSKSMLGLTCEIQTRTLAMDSWAKISHYLDYKQEDDIPKALRREFYALSGLLYVADIHFDRIAEERDRKRNEIAQLAESKSELTDVELDLDSLTTFLGSHFPEIAPANTVYYSELLADLLQHGYQTLGQLKSALSAKEPDRQKRHAVDLFLAQMGPVGIVRQMLELSQ
jgi:ppGpp synthetase/RelA/SpoT-type nucleotidyltranferase